MNKIEKSVNPITEGKIGKEMLLFFFPIMFGSLFQQIYNAVDTLIVGRTLGKIALSAVGGSSGMITLLVLSFFIGLSSGASVLVSQYFGAENEEKVRKTVHTILVFSVISGILVSILGILLSPVLLKWMSAPEDTVDWSLIYLRVYFAGFTANLLYNAGAGILRAAGDSRKPFIYLMIGCVLNILLDLLFILQLSLGVFGAALATVLSQAVSAVLVLITLARRKDACRLVLSELRIDGQILKKIIRIGLPSGVEGVMYALSNTVIQIGVNGFGTNYVAAWATYYKIDGLFWTTVSAFGIAGATFVGQNIGAGKSERVRKSLRISMTQALTAAVVISVLVYLLCPYIFPLFSTDPAVNAIGVAMMRFLTLFYILYVPIEIISGALRGAQDTFVPMILSLTCICAIRSLWILAVLPKYHTMYIMMLSYPISWVICAAAFFLYLFRFSKLKPYLQKK